MALNQFTNNAGTTLASGINASVTSLTVSTGSGALFPTLTGSAYFYCTLQQVSGGGIEIVKVTARSTDTFTIVRAQDGTTGLSFVTGDTVQLRLTAADLNNFPQLDSTNTFASAQTFTAAPILTALTGVVYGNGASASTVATGAQLATAIGSTTITNATNATNVTGTVGVANGGTGVATLTTAYGVLAAGTTATGAVQNIGTGTTNQVLTSNGPGVLPSFKAAATGGFSNMTVFTSPGTFTTPASTTQIKVTVVGGGGSGSYVIGPTQIGGAGGGGGYGIYVGPVTASTPYAVTVGTGGTQPPTSPANGNPGGTSSFGPIISCTGGSGGVVGPGSAPGGAGGTATGATFSVAGQQGAPGNTVAAGSSSSGGSTLLGTAASGGGNPSSSTVVVASGYGSGGEGGNTPTGGRGTGLSGVVIVEY